MKFGYSVIGMLFGVIVSVYGQNPIFPGYFADPSIRHIDGKYYMSVTSDGYENHNGEPFIWVSEDLVNWDVKYLDINDRFFWAPSMIKGDDEKYYMVHQQGVDYLAYMMESESPFGPWKETFQIKDFDVELFRDPVSHKIMGIGSWKNLLIFDSDVHSPTYMKKVVSSQPLQGEFTDFTEGPYLFYKDKKYYLLWAGGHCWLDSYNVRYAMADSPQGVYHEPIKKPILETTPAKDIYGPGHTSVIEVNGRWFLLYHRQDSSRHPTCNYRFVCAAEMFFNSKGEIVKIEPVDDFSSLGLEKKHEYKNLALDKTVTTNSFVKDCPPALAVDGRNDSRWQAEFGEDKWITVDLGKVESISGVQVDFEYFDKYYLYKIEYSDDNEDWAVYADYSKRAQKAYETRFSKKEIRARYIRVNVKRTEAKSAPVSIWEIKVLSNNN
jgi:beta-xylosidase